MKEIGQELFSSKFFNVLKDITFSPSLQKAAVCGDNSIKVLEAGNWKNILETFVIDNLNGNLESLNWTLDGSILSTSTSGGTIYNFLTKVPLVNSSYETTLVCILLWFFFL